jgi:predicted chitinase
VRRKAVAHGNTEPGDGARFPGRGLIHLTWRNGYRSYGAYRARDFTTDPNSQLLQSDAEIAADSAGYFWVKTGIHLRADKGSSNRDVQGCSRLVGGAGGLPEREQFFRYAYFILNDVAQMPEGANLKLQTEDDT